MNDLQSFDGDLRMFREAPRPVDIDHLRFLRWLAERGGLEHPVAGPPTGELAAVHAAHQRLAGAA
jgi:hypothetical protein